MTYVPNQTLARGIGAVLTFAGALAVMIAGLVIDHSAAPVAGALVLAACQAAFVRGWWQVDSTWEHIVLGAIFAFSSILTAVVMLFLWSTVNIGFMALVWGLVAAYLCFRYFPRWMDWV